MLKNFQIMNEQIINKLQQLHFSLNEARVYTALLEIGQTSAGEVIKKTGLHRSVVYETLDKLISRKLVFKLQKQNITYFQPTDPQRILQEVASQQALAHEIIPNLQSLIDQKLPEITIYEGVESYRKFWLESIEKRPEGSIDYVAGSTGDKFQKYMGDVYLDRYMKDMIKKKKRLKAIVFMKDPWEVAMQQTYPDQMEFRIIERGTPSEGNFNIWGETVILQSATEPLLIEIKNPTLVRVFQNIFDILWEQAKPL